MWSCRYDAVGVVLRVVVPRDGEVGPRLMCLDRIEHIDARRRDVGVVTPRRPAVIALVVPAGQEVVPQAERRTYPSNSAMVGPRPPLVLEVEESAIDVGSVDRHGQRFGDPGTRRRRSAAHRHCGTRCGR